MSMMRLARVCLTGAVLSLAVSRGAAHPPDLPADTKDICVPFPQEDYGELNTRRPRASLDVPSPMLEEIIARVYESVTFSLSGIPGFDLDLEFFLAGDQGTLLDQPLMDAEIIRTKFASPAVVKVDPARRAHARKMYLIGERCRRKGDYEMAENCYTETKLLCPGCDYARKAERRIAQVQAMRALDAEDIGEESEPAKEETPKEPMPEEEYEIRLEVPMGSGLGFGLDEAELRERMRQEAEWMREEGKRIGEPQEPAKKEKGPTDEHLRTWFHEALPPGIARGIDSNGLCWEGVTVLCWPTCCEESKQGARDKRLVFEIDWIKLAEAKGMYRIGERCRRGGDLGMAYRCYEAAHRVCPQSRHARMARKRMQQVRKDCEAKARENAKARGVNKIYAVNGIWHAETISGDLQVLAIPVAPQSITPDVIGALDRLLETASPPTTINIGEEESEPMPGEDGEESEYPLTQCTHFKSSSQSEPPVLYVASAERDLILLEERDEAAPLRPVPTGDDLSDWLPQTIRLLRGSGSLRIDASRLRRLMRQGEEAIRALGCDLVHECGRSFVIYPRQPQ